MSDVDEDLWALRRLAEAHRLQDWMFSVLAPSSPGRMLEIGAGIGTFSRLLLDAGASSLLLIEPEPACVAELDGERSGRQERARHSQADPGDEHVERAIQRVPSAASHVAGTPRRR